MKKGRQDRIAETLTRPQDNAVQDNNTVTDFYLSHSPSRYLSHLNNLFFSKIISTVTV